MKKTARDHFLGQNGQRRLNCAQSVAETFREKFPLEEQTMTRLSSCGGGMAPEGLCGAFYAAKCILKNHLPSRIENSSKEFQKIAGSLQCRTIRSLKKLSCVGCVEKAAEMLSEK